jgi:hypothetical protein
MFVLIYLSIYLIIYLFIYYLLYAKSNVSVEKLDFTRVWVVLDSDLCPDLGYSDRF